MRLNEDILCRNEEEKENGRDPQSYSIVAGFPQPQQVVVGYALTSKKTKSFLQPKLEGLARNKGILFVAIDQNRPLLEQGPFDILLHKLSGKEWRQILEDYRQNHPEVTVLDPPDAIQRVHNLQSLLQDVADLNLSDCYGNYCCSFPSDRTYLGIIVGTDSGSFFCFLIKNNVDALGFILF